MARIGKASAGIPIPARPIQVGQTMPSGGQYLLLSSAASLPNEGDYYFTAYQQDSNGDLDESTAKEFVGTPDKPNNRLTNVRATTGDAEIPAGSWVVASPTSAWVNDASDEVQAIRDLAETAQIGGTGVTDQHIRDIIQVATAKNVKEVAFDPDTRNLTVTHNDDSTTVINIPAHRTEAEIQALIDHANANDIEDGAINGRVLTFTKGDGSTTNLTIPLPTGGQLVAILQGLAGDNRLDKSAVKGLESLVTKKGVRLYSNEVASADTQDIIFVEPNEPSILITHVGQGAAPVSYTHLTLPTILLV